MSWLLTPLQKQERILKLFGRCVKTIRTIFDIVITQDETWVHHYDPQTKAQSMQRKQYDSPSSKKACAQPSAGKNTLTVFWDQRGVVTVDFLAKGTAITATYCALLQKKLRNTVLTGRHGMLTKMV